MGAADITVGHKGVRERLTGRISVTTNMKGSYTQMFVAKSIGGDRESKIRQPIVQNAQYFSIKEEEFIPAPVEQPPHSVVKPNVVIPKKFNRFSEIDLVETGDE
jgi:hypothetical protein